jgi:hypothetical protein
MKTVRKTITATVVTAVLLGASSIASANGAAAPPMAPYIYDDGPANPILNMTNMREVEKVAYSLGEALMQTTEAYVYVNGCKEFTRPVEIYSAPEFNDNDLTVGETLGMVLEATITPEVIHFGQQIDVALDLMYPAFLNGYPVDDVTGRYRYNLTNNLMVNKNTIIKLKGQRGGIDKYLSTVIKDFYHGGTFDDSNDYYVMYDWGLQSLSKSGYPVNKWWQKSKSVRDNGVAACFVLQKDRLVGAGKCRITLATTGFSQPGLFWQDGSLTVEPVAPNAPSEALMNCMGPYENQP